MVINRGMLFCMKGNMQGIIIKGSGEIEVEGSRDVNIVKSEIEIPVRWGTDSHIEVEKMGAFSYFCNNSYMRNVKKIGRFTSISSDFVAGLPQHPTSLISSSSFLLGKSRNNWYLPYIKKNSEYEKWIDSNVSFYRKNEEKRKEIYIGNDVWIGQGVTINGGVTIGDGAVIGTGAIVTKDVEPYSIVAGVPARVIRKRFDEKIIEQLLDIKWWNYGPEILVGLKPDITISIGELKERVERMNEQYKTDTIEFLHKEKTIYLKEANERTLLYKFI